jgi:hypothetical protein
MMGLWGAEALFAINTLSFIGVIFAVWNTPDAPAPPRDDTSPWERTREAARFVFRHRGPFRIFLAMLAFAALAAPLIRLLPVFAADVYGTEADPVARLFDLDDAALFGVMLSVMGLGAVVGGLALKLIPPWYPKHHFIPLSVFLGGVAITMWSALDGIGPGAVAIFFCGVFWLWAFNTSMAAMQLLVDDRMRGRVLAVCNTAIFGATPIGSLAAGYIGHYVSGSASEGPGAQVGVGVFAILLAIAGLAMLIWRTPEIDGAESGAAPMERRPGLLRGITATAHRPPE